MKDFSNITKDNIIPIYDKTPELKRYERYSPE
jgi:hypothetical protein